MEQNVKACNESILRIKKKLDELGIDNINVDNGLLVKTSSLSSYTGSLGNLASNPNCKCVQNNITVDITKECPYKNSCNVVSTECPLHKARCSGSGNVSGNGSKLSSKYNCLFRIKPSDIQNGINLYAVILHDESCELKLLFSPSIQGEKDLIETLKFLI